MEDRKLDAEVAERVTGLKEVQFVGERLQYHVPEHGVTYGGRWRAVVPRYSESIEAAWQVIEKMMQLGFRYVMRGNFENNGLHHAAFDHADWADANPLYQSPLGPSLPECICRAALIAVEANQHQVKK